MLAGPPFPPVPLIVLAATDHGVTPEREALWHEVQAQTAALSPRGRLQVVPGSGHFIQNDRPEVVIDAVLAGHARGGSGHRRVPTSRAAMKLFAHRAIETAAAVGDVVRWPAVNARIPDDHLTIWHAIRPRG